MPEQQSRFPPDIPQKPREQTCMGRMIVIEQFRFYGDFPVDRCAHNDLVAGPGQAEANLLIGRPRRSEASEIAGDRQI
jgi:hypothetical protein